MKRCTNCLLPENWPNISFNDRSVCSVCTEQESESAICEHDARERNRRVWKVEMDRLLDSSRGRGRYDILVLLSGGKDSTYLLWHLKEQYRLNTLAFSCDNGFLSDVAKTNIEQTVTKLGVDHVWGKPPTSFTSRLFRVLLAEASKRSLPAPAMVCRTCFSVTCAVAIKTAVEMRIPLLAVGLSPAQKPDAPHYRVPADNVRKFVECSQRDPDSSFGLRLTADQAAYFAVPATSPEELPTIIHPFLALDYDVEEILRTVAEKGLIPAGNEHPLLSNCLVNLLMIDFDLVRFGYYGYEGEISELLRKGKLDREAWRALYDRVNSEVDQGVFMKEKIDWVLDQIGLVKSDPPRYRLVPLKRPSN